MPNWTDNSVTFYGPPQEIFGLWAIFRNPNPFQTIRPCPPELLEEEPFADDPSTEHRLIEQYGYSDWYNWRVAKWGTKWDVVDPDVEPIQNVIGDEQHAFSATFNTAWAAPKELLRYITEKYPAVSIIGSYVQEEEPNIEHRYHVAYGAFVEDGTAIIHDDYEDDNWEEYISETTDSPSEPSFRAVTGTATRLPLP
jgi:hypothetical protein